MANDLRVLVYPNKADKSIFFELDVFNEGGEAGNFPLTFQIIDISEPKNRKSDVSKTLTFPGTDRNNIFFTQLYEITVDSSFNPNLKKYVSIQQDGQEVLRGTIKLNSIKREKFNRISYECTVFGQFANLFQDLKITDLVTGQERDLLVRDLFSNDVETEFGFTNLDHNYRIPIIQNTWSGEFAVGTTGLTGTSIQYSAPIAFADTFWNASGDWAGRVGLTGATAHGLQIGDTIFVRVNNSSGNPPYRGDHTVVEVPDANSLVINEYFGNAIANESGEFNITTATGEGYVYPMVDYNLTVSSDVWSIYNFKPSLYVKEVLDRIFDFAGYNYSSQFFDSQMFKRLLYTSVSGEEFKLFEQDIIDRLFRASKTTNSAQVRYDWESWTGSTYSISQKFIANDDSTNGNFDNPLDYNVSLGDLVISNAGFYDIECQINTGSFIEAVGASGELRTYLNVPTARLEAQIYFVKDGSVIYTGPITTYKADNGSTITVGISGYTFNDQIVKGQIVNYFLATGETIEVYLHFACYLALGTDPTAVNAYLSSPSGLNDIEGEWYLTMGQGVIFNAITNPSLVEESTIAMSAIQDQKFTASQFLSSIFSMFNLYVLPDKSQEKLLTIEPHDDFYYDDQVVNWTDKLDRIRELEIEPLGLVQAKTYSFGYKEDKDLQNDLYLKENLQTYGSQVITTENDFTKNKKEIKLDFSPSPLVPVDGKPITLIVKDNNAASIAFNPRILYYKGLINCSADQWTFVAENQIFYPYAGHLDDNYDPTIDLNFGYARLYYQGNLTENTLINRYYLNYLEEILSKDSRVVTGYFKLNAKDIRELDFRKQVIIDGVRYRLLKVSDYNATRQDLTQVQLLKVLNGVKFTPKSGNYGVTSGVNGTDTLGVVLPSINDTEGKNTGNGNSGVGANSLVNDVIILGADNSIRNRGKEILIQGNRNDIQATSKVHIIGDDNLVLAGTERISLINSDGNTVLPGTTDVFLINTTGLTVGDSNTVYIDGAPYVPGGTGATSTIPNLFVDNIYSVDTLSDINFFNSISLTGGATLLGDQIGSVLSPIGTIYVDQIGTPAVPVSNIYGSSIVIGSTAISNNTISLNEEFIYMGITAVGTNYIRSNGQYFGIQTKNPGTGTYGTIPFYVFDDGAGAPDTGVFVGGRLQQFIKPGATSTNTRGFVTYGGAAGTDGGTYEFIFRNNETVFKAESVSTDIFFRLSATAHEVKVQTDLVVEKDFRVSQKFSTGATYTPALYAFGGTVGTVRDYSYNGATFSLGTGFVNGDLIQAELPAIVNATPNISGIIDFQSTIFIGSTVKFLSPLVSVGSGYVIATVNSSRVQSDSIIFLQFNNKNNDGTIILDTGFNTFSVTLTVGTIIAGTSFDIVINPTDTDTWIETFEILSGVSISWFIVNAV